MSVQEEQFEWDAFIFDTNELSLAAVGAWIKCLHKMRKSVTRGRISMPIEGYARMFGSTVDHAQKVIDEIATYRVGDAERDVNSNITLTNRRMFRVWEAKEANRIRQLEWQQKKREEENEKNNVPITEKYKNITNLPYISSSSLNSSLPEKEKDLRRKKSKIYVEQVFAHWQTVLDHPKAILTKERERCISSRLEEGYSVEDLMRAVDGCKASPYHNGKNDSGSIFHDPTLIFRSGSKVEQFIGYLDNKKPNGTNSKYPQRRSNVTVLEESEQYFRDKLRAEEANNGGGTGNIHPDQQDPGTARMDAIDRKRA